MAEPIPFCDLARINAPFRAEIDRAVAAVVDRGWFLRGPETVAFEEAWAAACGQAHCVACNSGTDALTLAALALGLTTAQVPANTLPLTAIGLARAGVTVTAAEVGADGRLAAPAADAVPVLLYGRAPRAAEARARLFDAAHAHGWKPPAGAVACWSFYPTKSLGAFGDGGAVTTDDAALAAAMRALAGRDDRLRDGRQLTSRMDEIQAAVLRVKLRRLGEALAARRDIAARYAALLPAAVTPVSDGPADLHHLYVVRTAGRDDLQRHLAAHGVETKVHFPEPLHRQSAPWGAPDAPRPGADAWCDSVLSLPCYPGLTAREVDRVAALVGAWAAARPT